MTNKRTLKKIVRLYCGDLAAECAMAIDVFDGINVEKMLENIRDIARLQETTLANISFSFDKTPSDFENKALYRKALHAYNKAAFAKLQKDFNEQVQEIVKNMNACLPNRAEK